MPKIQVCPVNATLGILGLIGVRLYGRGKKVYMGSRYQVGTPAKSSHDASQIHG